MDWLREHGWWPAWLALAALLAGAELLSLDLVLLMLAVGAVAGAGADGLGAPLVLQVIVAAVASAAMLGFVRPSVVRRLHGGPDLRHGPAALVGQEGHATAEISARSGLAKLGGETWTARPYDEDEVIPAGAKVQVLEIRGATAYVTEVPQLGS